LKSTPTHFALDSLYYTGAYRLLESQWSGVGVIFTLHHVRDTEQAEFSPNRILEISSGFLDQTICQVKESGRDIVTLDEARRRLIKGDFSRKFVCFTLDDGYADIFLNALPIFVKHNAPFTVYVTTDLPDGTAVLWWRHLEEIIQAEDELELRLPNRELQFSIRSIRKKYRAFQTAYWALRRLHQEQQCEAIQQLLEKYGADSRALCRQWAMTWDMIMDLADSDLATIGAHTVNHNALSKLSIEQVRSQAEMSRQLIADRTGHEPTHFTYPYGDPSSASQREFEIMNELGFATATTTRKGMLFPEHADHLHVLPRVSLNGDYQNSRYVRLFLSGAPFALWQRFRRLDID